MKYQLYWFHWWKLWPYYSRNIQWVYDHGYYVHTFRFGPIQIEWGGMINDRA